MEGLVLLLAELAFLLLAPVAALFATVFGAFFEALALLFGTLFGSAAGSIRFPKGLGKVLRWGTHLTLTAGVLALIAVLIANTFFFDRIVGRVLAGVEDKTGYAIEVEDASGSLLTGRFAFDGMTIDRASDTGISADVEVVRVEAKVRLTTLLSDVVVLDRLDVSGLTGAVALPDEDPEREKPRRSFAATEARVTNMSLRVTKGGRAPALVEIPEVTSAPFRSRSAAFDLFFRSNLTGTVNGAPIRIETREISAEGRETLWEIEALPVDTLQSVSDAALVSMLDGGTLSATVTDVWTLDDRVDIDADWTVGFDGVSLRAPESAGLIDQALYRTAAAVLSRGGASPTLRFTIDLEEEQWQDENGQADAGKLVDAIFDGVRFTMLSAEPDASAADEEEGDGDEALTDRIRGLFDRD